MAITKRTAVLATALALSACGGGSEPSGQVVATVGGEEITAAELNLELAGQTGGTPAEQRARRDAALESLVNRRILAQAAREQGVDETPVGAMQLKRAEEMALIGLLQQGGPTAAQTVSDAEARAYVEANPDRFADRRLFVVNQLNVPNSSPDLVKAMEPLDTMAQIRQLLDGRGVAYGETVGVVDSLAIPTNASRQIAAMQPGAVFLAPEGPLLRVNELREVDSQPITGPSAIAAAKGLLSAERAQGQAGQRLEAAIAAGRKDVQFNPQYKPAAPAR